MPIINSFIHTYYAFFCVDDPGNVSLNVSVSSNQVCAVVMVRFTCTAEANPPVHSYRLYENGRMIANMDGSGVWIRTLNTSGQFNYSCEAINSVGNDKSNDIPLTVGGEIELMCSAMP